MTLRYIKANAIKARAKLAGKRVGKDFLALVDDSIGRKIEAAIEFKNGSLKTINEAVGIYVGFKKNM